MAELKITKNGTEIILPEFGRNYSQGWIDFEVTERTINRTLVSDFVNFKRVFLLNWDIIDETIMFDIIDLYLDKEDVIFSELQSDGTTVKSWTVRINLEGSIIRDIEAQRFAFTGFAFNLEEV